MRKRNVLYSLGVSVILAGAASAWKSVTPDTTGGGSVSAHPGADVEPTTEKKSGMPAGLSYASAYASHVEALYGELGLAQEGLTREAFGKAITGYYNLKAKGKLPGKKDVLSIVDFTRSSREKRLWIIDLAKKELLHHTLVAHGQGSGANKATRFSNTESSHQSSLGFYITGEVYYGKHGRSLRLDGMDPGFNSNARRRAIVLHGADYVSESFVDRAGRLGRSYGCPAVPVAVCDDIIDDISEKTVLFINGPDPAYESDYLNAQAAAQYAVPANG